MPTMPGLSTAPSRKPFLSLGSIIERCKPNPKRGNYKLLGGIVCGASGLIAAMSTPGQLRKLQQRGWRRLPRSASVARR